MEVRDLVTEELDKIDNGKVQLHDGCVACHIMFLLKKDMQKPEQDAADALSELLSKDAPLNEKFIETVEKVHMIERGLGGSFPLRERDSKDAYLDAYFKNVLDELEADLKEYGKDAVLRKLVLSYINLYLAQTIGVDYHAATEEVYYMLRKDSTGKKNQEIDRLVKKTLNT